MSTAAVVPLQRLPPHRSAASERGRGGAGPTFDDTQWSGGVARGGGAAGAGPPDTRTSRPATASYRRSRTAAERLAALQLASPEPWPIEHLTPSAAAKAMAEAAAAALAASAVSPQRAQSARLSALSFTTAAASAPPPRATTPTALSAAVDPRKVRALGPRPATAGHVLLPGESSGSARMGASSSDDRGSGGGSGSGEGSCCSGGGGAAAASAADAPAAAALPPWARFAVTTPDAARMRASKGGAVALHTAGIDATLLQRRPQLSVPAAAAGGGGGGTVAAAEAEATALDHAEAAGQAALLYKLASSFRRPTTAPGLRRVDTAPRPRVRWLERAAAASPARLSSRRERSRAGSARLFMRRHLRAWHVKVSADMRTRRAMVSNIVVRAGGRDGAVAVCLFLMRGAAQTGAFSAARATVLEKRLIERSAGLLNRLARGVIHRRLAQQRAAARAVIVRYMWRCACRRRRAYRVWERRLAARRVQRWYRRLAANFSRRGGAARIIARALEQNRLNRAAARWRAGETVARQAAARRIQAEFRSSVADWTFRRRVIVRIRTHMRMCARRARARVAFRHALLAPIHAEMLFAATFRREGIERGAATTLQCAWRSHVARALVGAIRLHNRVEANCEVRRCLRARQVAGGGGGGGGGV
jgi:hypothetical protein